jgi:hypothetical protein
MFTAEKFNADEWADLFQKSGARFAGPVAEHHDGFSMWNTKFSEWNAAKMGPKRDKDVLAYYFNKAAAENKEVVVTYKGHHLPPGVALNDLELGQERDLTYHEWITDSSVDNHPFHRQRQHSLRHGSRLAGRESPHQEPGRWPGPQPEFLERALPLCDRLHPHARGRQGAQVGNDNGRAHGGDDENQAL